MNASMIEQLLREDLEGMDDLELIEAGEDAGVKDAMSMSRKDLINEMVRLELYAAFH